MMRPVSRPANPCRIFSVWAKRGQWHGNAEQQQEQEQRPHPRSFFFLPFLWPNRTRRERDRQIERRAIGGNGGQHRRLHAGNKLLSPMAHYSVSRFLFAGKITRKRINNKINMLNSVRSVSMSCRGIPAPGRGRAFRLRPEPRGRVSAIRFQSLMQGYQAADAAKGGRRGLAPSLPRTGFRPSFLRLRFATAPCSRGPPQSLFSPSIPSLGDGQGLLRATTQ